MAKQNLSEQLDSIVEALVARPRVASVRREPKAGAKLQALAQIAAQLRDLPGENFKARLKLDLERRTSMASKPVTAAEARQTAVPYICVRDAAAAIDFYKNAFGATEVMRLVGPDKKIGHAEIRIGNSVIYLSDEFPDHGAISPQTLGGSPVRMTLSVDNVDAVAARAVAAGAKEVRPIEDQFYGERSGLFADPFGYMWNISTLKEEMSGAEMQKRMDALMNQGASSTAPPAVKPIPEGFHTLTQYLAVKGAATLIDFFKQAFGATEAFRVPRPGTQLIMHAQLRIGDSILELADATEEFGARAVANILHVDDVAAVYQRAMKAGGTSLSAPHEQPYGDFEAGVKDPAGNQWYLTAIRKTGHRTDDTGTILPHLSLVHAAEFVEFTKRAFGAEVAFMHDAPDGKVLHARIRIGDSILAVGEASDQRAALPAALHMYVPNVDSVYAAAVREGAKVLRPLRDEPYGDRAASLQDAFGNWWFPSTHIKDVPA